MSTLELLVPQRLGSLKRLLIKGTAQAKLDEAVGFGGIENAQGLLIRRRRWGA